MTTIEHLLQRSIELEETIFKLLNGATYSDSPRSLATLTMCDIALEHADSFRLLTANGNFTSAVSLIRLQFEAISRAIWLLYAASDSAIGKLQAPLTAESEKAADNQPSIKEILSQIEKKAPVGAGQMLADFKEVIWKAINSYVHSGIHAVNRHGEGYPVGLIIQVLQNSNALSSMTGMLLANLSDDIQITKPMSKIQQDFKDCLPPLLQNA